MLQEARSSNLLGSKSFWVDFLASAVLETLLPVTWLVGPEELNDRQIRIPLLGEHSKHKEL